MNKTYSRGQLAKASGVNAETIRFYETKGLLSEPERSEGGHRIYRDDDLKQLNFLHRCRELGFSLQEIAELQELSGKSSNTCDSVKGITMKHIGDVQKRIRDLRKMEQSLKQLVSECSNGVEACPMMDILFED